MKYAIALLAGFLLGAAVFAAGFFFNPFAGQSELSQLAISTKGISTMSYSPVGAEAIVVTNNGESMSKPKPAKVAELWEPTIKDTRLLVTRLLDSRGEPMGIGIKFSTPSEETSLIKSELLVDSVWHLYLPGRGTLAVQQQEDYWAYLRDIVVPAWRSSSDSWRGTWSFNMTVGPNALGTGRVFGLGGEFRGLDSEAVEILNAKAYSAQQGPVAMTGTLSVKLQSDPQRAASN